MNFIDKTLASPEQNIAFDEALLDFCEAHGQTEILRFWESEPYFVVLGYSNKVQEEAHVKACQQDEIPILRRCSGGGTVLQGKGCLNYSLILRIDHGPGLQNISKTNEYVMSENAKILSELTGESAQVKGHTDLTLGSQKFSGNAQRRLKRTVLFHGTFLVDFNLSQITRYLAMPPKQPCYRESRPHEHFLKNIKIPRETIKSSLKKAWNASQVFDEDLSMQTERLVEERYGQEAWNFKF